MSFTPLTSGGRGDAVRDQLLEAITRGDFRPGDKLPSESVLVAEFGVSRVSVREGLRALQAHGIVEIHHGRGSFVARGPGERYLEPFVSWLQVHRDEIIDLLKVRGALDELAAAEAAAAGTAVRIGEIVELNERFTAGSRDPDASMEDLTQLDIDFHNAIAVASESSLLPGLLGELNTVFAESRRAAFGLRGRAERSADEHAEIVAAIRDGDPVRAREAAARHLASTRTTFGDPAYLRELAEVTKNTENNTDDGGDPARVTPLRED